MAATLYKNPRDRKPGGQLSGHVHIANKGLCAKPKLWLPKIVSGLAQLPPWATLIAGMIDLLKLLGGFARRSVQIACGSRSRDGISPPAACCAAAIRAGEAQAALCRSLVFVWLYRLLPSLLEAAVVFKPETLVRWHRSGFRLYWRCKSRRRVGRPAVPADIGN